MSDREHCKGYVGNKFYPCQRAVSQDGYCPSHHPEAVAVRQAKREQKFRQWMSEKELTNAIRRAEVAVIEAAMRWNEDGANGNERAICVACDELAELRQKQRDLTAKARTE